MRQEDVRLRGHAIECRINAEDVGRGLPARARADHRLSRAFRAGVRVDSGVVAGAEISGLYDPMIAKLIVHGVDREHARMRMLRALDEFEIGGVPTLLGFHRALLSHPCFVAGETCDGVVESPELAAAGGGADSVETTAAARLDGRVRPRVRSVEVGGPALRGDGARARAAVGRARAAPPGARRAAGRAVRAPKRW